MTRKSVAIALTSVILVFTLSLSGCDMLQDLLGGMGPGGSPGGGIGGGGMTLTANQQLLQKLFQALAKGTAEVTQYEQTHSGAFPTGYSRTTSSNVITATFTNYANADGVIINGTDTMTFNGTPPPTGSGLLTAGDLAVTLSGTITGGPYTLSVKMTRAATTPPPAPTFTECKVNGTSMLSDYQSMMSGGGAGMGGPGTSGGTPITLPDALAQDAAYASLETDFFNEINARRTTASVAVFAARDSALDALARRYARAGAIDTPQILESRVTSIAGVTNTDAASLGFGGTSVTVAQAMSTWTSAQVNGLATMTNSAFTKVGIGMTTGPAPGGIPGETWVHVYVIFVKP